MSSAIASKTRMVPLGLPAWRWDTTRRAAIQSHRIAFDLMRSAVSESGTREAEQNRVARSHGTRSIDAEAGDTSSRGSAMDGRTLCVALANERSAVCRMGMRPLAYRQNAAFVA